jgi:hypothetical protein
VIRRRGLSLWGPSSGRSLLENPSDGSRRDQNPALATVWAMRS